MEPGGNPGLYEVENEAIDHEGLVWAALESVAAWTDQHIVDLGCGTGFWLSRYSDPAGLLTGVEPDDTLLPAARARPGGSRVMQGSAVHIPLIDASADVVHARFAYFVPTSEHDCGPGLREVLRVLRASDDDVVVLRLFAACAEESERSASSAVLLAGKDGGTTLALRGWALQCGVILNTPATAESSPSGGGGWSC